ncbi:hypothetical protein B0T22DRAFT_511739 [Podospora appendiculata]|uniref:RRM domain-containing protein n=1 Tax=Podospora appendiculata TaxID=314037 RepID=A0AAE0X966_9PEZI|nr:hypothetical protein B0T22DRAFT_511739 [Podospora appendiculata]
MDTTHAGESPDGADKESNSSSTLSSSDVFSPVIWHGGKVAQGKLEPAGQQLTPGTSPPGQILDSSRVSIGSARKDVDLCSEIMLLQDLHIAHERHRQAEVQRRGLIATPSKGQEKEMAVRTLETRATQESAKSGSRGESSAKSPDEIVLRPWAVSWPRTESHQRRLSDQLHFPLSPPSGTASNIPWTSAGGLHDANHRGADLLGHGSTGYRAGRCAAPPGGLPPPSHRTAATSSLTNAWNFQPGSTTASSRPRHAASAGTEFEQDNIMPSFSNLNLNSFDVLDHLAGPHHEIKGHRHDDDDDSDREGTYISTGASGVKDRSMASMQANVLHMEPFRQPMGRPARYDDMLARNFGRLATHLPDDDRLFTTSRFTGPGAVGEAVQPRSGVAGLSKAMQRLQLSSPSSKLSSNTAPSHESCSSHHDQQHQQYHRLDTQMTQSTVTGTTTDSVTTVTPTFYRPMEVRPVKRVSQDQAFDLILKGFSANYRGNPDLDRNRSAEIAPDENCSLFIVGLDPRITTHELLASIRDVGRVYATHINPPEPDRGHLTCAAKVVFFERAAAERFYARFATTGLYIPSHPASPGRVTWNRVRTAQYDAGGRKTRVLLISGPAAFVNESTLRAYFSSKLQYQVDGVVRRGHDPARARALVEFRFGSFRCQAEAAWMALNREFKDLGVVVVFGRDPCDRVEEHLESCSHVLE